MGRPLNKKFFGANAGDNASVTVNVNGGIVDAVTVVSGGAGYVDGTGLTLTLTAAAGGGDGAAEITYDVVAGVVGNASVSAGGTTYTNGDDQAVTEFPASPNTSVQVLGTAWIPGSIAGAAEAVFIRRQRSSRKYQVESIANADYGVCKTVPTGVLASGEMHIEVEPSDGAGGSTGTEYAKIITGRRLRTFEGETYAWGDLVIDTVGEGGPGPDFPAV